MQKNLGKLLDKISHESSFNSVQHTYGVVYCQDLEIWDGDIWYNDDDLEADFHPTPKAEKVQPLIETETVHEGGGETHTTVPWRVRYIAGRTF